MISLLSLWSYFVYKVHGNQSIFARIITHTDRKIKLINIFKTVLESTKKDIFLKKWLIKNVF